MSPLASRQVVRFSLAMLTALAMLPLSACDHAKDLVEQGKKQAEDIQKSIEGKTETAAKPSATENSTSPPAAAPPAAVPAVQPAAPPAAADANRLVDTFLRGDPEARTDGMLHTLAALPEEYRARITKCDLTDSHVTDAGLAEIAKFPNLKLLNLSSCSRITSNGLEVFKELKMLETLIAEHGVIADSNVSYVCQLPNLKVLNINHTAITDAGVVQLSALTHLEELHISSTTVNGSCFLKAPWIGTLRVLHANLTSVGQDVKVMRKFHDLEELGLHRAQVTDQTVAALKGASKMRKLYLGENHLSDNGVKQLSGLTSIEVLSLSKNSITDNCLPTFKICKKLTRFGEGGTGVTAAGRDYLKKIAPECTFEMN